jgi:metal-responsive CopG/Arc/MetJ family transcriptional regulator
MVHMQGRRRSKDQSAATTRASVSFPTQVYEELERLAVAKKVSLAWVIRDAAEKYVADQWPLLATSDTERHRP